MQQHSVFNSYYVTLLKENYNYLYKLCHLLEEDGYWKEPESYLNNSIYENLDLYVQGVLIHFSIYCGRLSTFTKEVIAEATQMNVLSVEPEMDYPEEVIQLAKHVVNGPPILIQLCSLYDHEKGTNSASVFIDHMMSMLLAFANMNAGRDRTALSFIEKYYEKSVRFICSEQVEICLGKRYLFKKISSDAVVNLIEMQELVITNQTRLPSSFIEVEKEVETKSLNELDKVSQEEIFQSLQECTNDIGKGDNEKESTLDILMSELNELIGLEEVKKQITSLINLIKVRKLREEFHMPVMEMTYHMVFYGNPGTGKTTVARLLSKIYQELGIVSKGTLVETDRSGLVAGYVGQTAIKVAEVVKSALGGVLFIDEAYSLTRQAGGNDYGKEVIDTLVKLMEDNRDDLVVIVAGYTKEMTEFLQANTGLISRFNTFIEFPDYTTSELLDILQSMASKAGVSFMKSARKRMKEYLSGLSEKEKIEFGNARGIRNLFEKILISQANRLVTLNKPTKKQLATIELEDVCGCIE